MSSILDALKKSEAERQRGVPPTLSTPILRHGQATKPQRPAWLLPAVAAVALVGAWAGGLFSSGDEEAMPASEPTAAQTPAKESPPVATAVPAPAPAVPAEPAPAVPEPPVASAAAPEVSAPDAQPARRVGFGPFPARPTTTPDPAPAPAPAPAPDAQAASGEAVAVPADPQVATAAPAPAPATAAPAPAAPVPAATPAAGSSTPTYNELPYAVRRDIPPIALTLHMYSTDPERRFAIINGVRARDGQPIEGGLEVVEIRPNGVLIRFKDTDFLFPSRG